MSDCSASPVSRRFPADHPVFAGHFPAHPIVPGALLLDLVLRQVALQRGTPVSTLRIDQAKFLYPVGPDEQVDLSVEPMADEASQRFTLRVGDQTVATGVVTIMRGAAV